MIIPVCISFGSLMTVEHDLLLLAQQKVSVTVNAIIYIAPGRWEVFLNGRACIPGRLPQDPVIIEDVTADTVTLRRQDDPDAKTYTVEVGGRLTYANGKTEITEAREPEIPPPKQERIL